ncbi:MAG: radical SAM/SPASM domain-containing protein, partial [Alphaproteobacteria bacterium]|nr:radical SAM/SPASM domain-containing protein [Alphaproteobacteria bacterium]
TTARDRGAVLAIQTNGTLLQKRSIRRRLLKARPATLGLSLDGFSADSYQKVRAGARWEALKAAIEAFVSERDDMGLRDEIRLYITSVFPGYAPEIAEQAERFFGTVASGSIPMHFIPLSTTYPTEFLSPDGELKTYEFAPAFNVFTDRPSCWEPLQKLQVLWDGTISACCVVPDSEFELGHAIDGVDTIWESEAMRHLQRAHLEHDLDGYTICQKCLGVDADVKPTRHNGMI